MSFVDKLFGNKSEKEIKRIEKYVDAIEALDEKMQALSDEPVSGSICCCKRGSRPYDPSEALSCAADGWYHFTSGSYCRDEDW